MPPGLLAASFARLLRCTGVNVPTGAGRAVGASATVTELDITSLSFKSATLRPRDALENSVMPAVAESVGLTSLRVADCELDCAAVRRLVGVSLYASAGSGAGSEGGVATTPVARPPVIARLQVLDLSHNQLCDEGAATLALALRQPPLSAPGTGPQQRRRAPPALRVLVLRSSFLPSAAGPGAAPGVALLLRALGEHDAERAHGGCALLRKLVLADNPLGPRLLPDLAGMLARARALVSLDLGNTAIAAAAAGGQERGPSFSRAMGTCVPGAVECRWAAFRAALAAALRGGAGRARLRELRLGRNRLFDGGAALLLGLSARGLEAPPPAPPAAGEAGSLGLPFAPGLRCLDLSGNRLTHAVVDLL
eukprot:g4694.t1